MVGQHCLRTWSSTQPSVTLSSGEAEYYGLVKAAGAGLGHQSLMSDLGVDLPVTAWTDSSAALGIASRSGLGKLRHLETHTLWLQEKVRTKAISVKKVWGEVNPADLFTKHLPSREKVHQLLGLFGCEYRSGRAAAAPLLRPLDSGGQQGGHLTDHDPLPTFAAETVDVPHDESRLPHMYPVDEIARLFPTIVAAPAAANVDDYNPRRDDDDGYLQQRGSGKSERCDSRGEQRESVDQRKMQRQPSSRVEPRAAPARRSRTSA